MKKILSIVLAVIFMIAGAIVLYPDRVNAATSEVDMVDACHIMYQGAWKVEVVVVEQNVMGWKCMINGYPYLLDINVSGWCSHKYGKYAMAKYYDFDDPYSWYCEY